MRTAHDNLAAFQRLLVAFGRELPKWFARFGLTGPLSEDAAQEALLRIWHEAPEIERDPAGQRVALLRIAHSVAQSVRRGNARTLRYDAEVAATMRGDAPDVEEGILLCLAIDRLQPRLREAVILCDVLGYEQRDAAAELGVTEANLKNLLARARNQVLEERRKKKQAGSAVIFLFAGLNLEPITRAAFAALLAAEGRLPVSGGPGGPPPEPPGPPGPTGSPVEASPDSWALPFDKTDAARWLAILLSSIVAYVAIGIVLFTPRPPVALARVGIEGLMVRLGAAAIPGPDAAPMVIDAPPPRPLPVKSTPGKGRSMGPARSILSSMPDPPDVPTPATATQVGL